MVTHYSKINDTYIITADEKDSCLALLSIIVDRCGLPAEVNIKNYLMDYVHFRYWYSCQLALSMSELKKRVSDSSEDISDFGLFL